MVQFSVSLPQGFTGVGLHCGLKENNQKDLAVIYSQVPANAVAVFTQNQVCGAPIIVGRKIIEKQTLQVIVINSEISNVCTGQDGIDKVYQTIEKAAQVLSVDPSYVLVSSTGLIAHPLPVEKIKTGLEQAKSKLQTNTKSIAEAIMTTDTHPKVLSYKIGEASLVIIAKGSGMIEPNMATMLAYILTDAKIEKQKLKSILKEVVNLSFNMLSVDTDTSTSDTVAMMANGIAGKVNEEEFTQTLKQGCIEMAKILAKDGEGATKLIQAQITGSSSENNAKILARSMVNSPLIKTMCYGADPNIGRILMALGKTTAIFELKKLEVKINDVLVFAQGELVQFDEKQLRLLLGQSEVLISVDLNQGQDQAIAYGCDLTEGYIKENAAYYSS